MARSRRIILFNGEVNEISSLKAIIQLLDYDSQSRYEPIYMYINSEGGSIDNGLAIYDTIKHIDAPVYTVCMGLAASMGAFLLCCGEKGHRACTKHSRILIHQPLIRGGAIKTESGIRRVAEGIREQRKILETIMSEQTEKPVEKIHEDCERDNWMTAEEALEYGLIDIII